MRAFKTIVRTLRARRCARSLQSRLMFSFAVMLLPIAIVGAGGVVLLERSSDRLAEIEGELTHETRAIDALRSAILRAEERAVDFVASGNAEARGRFERGAQEIDARLGTLELDGRRELGLAASAIEAWAGAYGMLTDADGGPGDRRARHALDRFQLRVHRTLVRLDALLQTSLRESHEEAAAQRRNLHLEGLLLAAGAGLSLVLSLLLAGSLGGTVRRPLDRLRQAARRVGEEDFSERVEVDSSREFAEVAEAFNTMTARLMESREQLVHQAFHDALTGLPNRALFADRAGHAAERTRRRPSPIAVMVIDLDDFKAVNDTLGHAAGDDVLIAVSERLRDAVRPENTVARLGGDEFAVLLEDPGSEEGARFVAGRIVEVLSAPVELRDRELPMQGSVGVALGAGVEVDAGELVRNADMALQTAKRGGKGTCRFFEPQMQAVARERFELEADLKRAVERDELMLVYQPVVELETGRVRGLEALVRWRHPRRGLVPPADFIPLAEASGLIVPIGNWVLERACAETNVLRTRLPAHSGIEVGVNISPRELARPDLADKIAGLLSESRCEPQCLVLEITETTLMAKTDETVARLACLKDLGLRLAIDDFGTGYSSLAYLRHFPLDVLKIDRSFVGDLQQESEDARTLARTVIELAHAFGFQTVAEGVETAEQLGILRDLGCDLGQGCHFARPMPMDDLVSMLERSSTVPELAAA
jgi:diguanylate cyclase (GGDEF)-like protein